MLSTSFFNTGRRASNRIKTLFGWRFNAAGVPRGEFKIPLENYFAYDDSVHMSIGMQSNGNFIATWTTRDKVFAERFDINGISFSDKALVLDSYDNCGFRYPAIAVQTNGTI